MDASFLGARVSVKTCAPPPLLSALALRPSPSCPRSSLGETHEGLIFTYDATSSALVLEQRKGMDQKVRPPLAVQTLLACGLPLGPVALGAGRLSYHKDKRCTRDSHARECCYDS